MRGPYRHAIAALLVVLGTMGMLQTCAQSGRRYGPSRQVVKVSGPAEAYRVWRGSGVKGRVLVYFRRSPDVRHIDAHGVMDDLSGREDMRLGEERLVSSLLAAGVVRSVYHVVPDDAWGTVEATLSASPAAVRVGETFRVRVDGAPVIVTRSSDLPAQREKVVVYVDEVDAPRYDQRVLGRYARDPSLSDFVVVGGRG